MGMRRHLRILDTGTEGGSMDTQIKVAFATSDMKVVDQHLGAARSFAVYAVDMDRASFTEVVQFGKLSMDGNEDKLAGKIESLDGCIAVYANAVGASAIAQLKANGVQPVKVSAGAPISELVEGLQQELRAGPSAWLARAIDQQKPESAERFDEMEQAGWEE
jgi:nitrogen fixation protein NifX